MSVSSTIHSSTHIEVVLHLKITGKTLLFCLFCYLFVWLQNGWGGGKKDLTKFCIGQKSLLNLMVVFRDFIYI